MKKPLKKGARLKDFELYYEDLEAPLTNKILRKLEVQSDKSKNVHSGKIPRVKRTHRGKQIPLAKRGGDEKNLYNDCKSSRKKKS